MIKAIAILMTLLAGHAIGETLRSPRSRDLTESYSNKCYLYDISKGINIRTLDGNYEKRYPIAPIYPYHKGYSIRCDFAPYAFDYMVWYFPDGGKNYRQENQHEWWLKGDKNGVPDRVEWMGQSGYKYIKVEGYKDGKVAFKETFELEAYCPAGYYSWYGHCYKWDW